MKTSNDAPNDNPILFTILHNGHEVSVRAKEDQYSSLMSLIADKIPMQGFGLCSGMGSCGTCLVSIYDRNSRLEKVALSCQVRVNDDLTSSKIILHRD
jgi:ferredoxin